EQSFLVDPFRTWYSQGCALLQSGGVPAGVFWGPPPQQPPGHPKMAAPGARLWGEKNCKLPTTPARGVLRCGRKGEKTRGRGGGSPRCGARGVLAFPFSPAAAGGKKDVAAALGSRGASIDTTLTEVVILIYAKATALHRAKYIVQECNIMSPFVFI